MPERDEGTDDHLCDVDDGAGCVEIWEKLSEARTTDQPASD